MSFWCDAIIVLGRCGKANGGSAAEDICPAGDDSQGDPKQSAPQVNARTRDALARTLGSPVVLVRAVTLDCYQIRRFSAAYSVKSLNWEKKWRPSDIALGCGSLEAPYFRVLKFHAVACLQLSSCRSASDHYLQRDPYRNKRGEVELADTYRNGHADPFNCHSRFAGMTRPFENGFPLSRE